MGATVSEMINLTQAVAGEEDVQFLLGMEVFPEAIT